MNIDLKLLPLAIVALVLFAGPDASAASSATASAGATIVEGIAIRSSENPLPDNIARIDAESSWGPLEVSVETSSEGKPGITRVVRGGHQISLDAKDATKDATGMISVVVHSQ